MFSTKSLQDKFKLTLPDEFIVEAVSKKYAKILQEYHGFIYKPIDFINESIQKIQILGFSEATVMQQQHGIGYPLYGDESRIDQNKFLHTGTDFVYRSEVNPLQLIDKTLNVTFKHNLGFINYFILFENFWHIYARDTQYKDMDNDFVIDIMNYEGFTYARIKLYNVHIHSMDMLDLDYTQPVASSQTFTISFKYSNIDFEFVTENLNKTFIFD